MITISLNGKPTTCEASTVADLLDELMIRKSGIAVALDGEVVPRSAWAEAGLANNVRVDVVTAAAGG